MNGVRNVPATTSMTPDSFVIDTCHWVVQPAEYGHLVPVAIPGWTAQFPTALVPAHLATPTSVVRARLTTCVRVAQLAKRVALATIAERDKPCSSANSSLDPR